MSDIATRDDIARLEQQICSLQEIIVTLLQAKQADEILTSSEAAKLLKVSERTLLRYVAADPGLAFRPSGKAKGDLRFYRSTLLSIKDRKINKRRGRKPRSVQII